MLCVKYIPSVPICIKMQILFEPRGLDNIMDLLHIFKISSVTAIKGKHDNEIHKSLLTTDELVYDFVKLKFHV